MDKQWFKNEVNKINVPTKEIRESIDKGINRAKREKRFRPKHAMKRTIFVSGAAAVLLLGSGFVSQRCKACWLTSRCLGKRINNSMTMSVKTWWRASLSLN
ncbi:hypothetical protein [Bacillus paralicheniformis]|uniref:hypothetical protein n=1 Tax=Bacillus paralicheniformis TaxID=1648923 RepID=UPI001F544ABD|nr:hypothetical protein [Bacillus paralicheniformis]